jgi:hypothetical protein
MVWVWFTLYMSSDYTLVAFTYNRIAFPVADSRILSYNNRALLNAETVGHTSPVVLFAISFTTLFLATQVLVHISSFALIFVDIEVNPFVPDLDFLFFIKTTGNLFWTPVLLN